MARLRWAELWLGILNGSSSSKYCGRGAGTTVCTNWGRHAEQLALDSWSVHCSGALITYLMVLLLYRRATTSNSALCDYYFHCLKCLHHKGLLELRLTSNFMQYAQQ